MKKLLFIITALLCLSVGVNAQWVFMANDTTNSNSHWSGYFASGSDNYTNITSNTADKVDGTASMQVDYKIHASEGWGGYTVRVFANDPTQPNSRYDLSSGKYLSYWYKVTQAATKTNAGDVNFEFKIKEKTGEGGEDRWLKSAGTILETAGDWTQVLIPLYQDSLGAPQAAEDNGIFEPWAVFGFELAFVYITGDNIHTASGQVLLDKFQILGARYEPVMDLDAASDTTSDRTRKDAFWALNDMSWDGDAGARHMILTTETTDKVQGTGALKVDYAVVGSQDWGGYAELEHIFETPVNLDERSALNFYFKNLVANQLTDRFVIRFDVSDIDPVTSATEMWTAMANINMDTTTGEWQFVSMPFYQATKATDGSNIPWYELKVGDLGFTHREGDNGKTFDVKNIKKIRMGLIILGGAKGPDKIASGQFLLDFFTPTGYKSTDVTAPDAPEDILAFANGNTNIVSWTDTPDESKEVYNIYYDTKPVTDVNGADVLTLSKGIPENGGSYTHYLYSPFNDMPVSYYYNMSAKDNAGNEGTLGMSSPKTTGNAKGVPVVSNIKPAGFVADGNLGEWANITPWEIKTSTGLGHKAALGWVVHDGDADLWYKAWVAISNDSLYVAYEVHDDLIVPDTTKQTYEVDSPDLFIGLYPYKGKDHVGLKRGATPDYHYRFNLHKATEDNNSGKTVSRMGDSNYAWVIQNDTVYTVEWAWSLASIAAEHDGDAVFAGTEGMMLALDFIVNDADATGTRESIISWSPLNDDSGYRDVTSWAYSWLGNANTTNFKYVGVEESGSVPQAFTLEQNYPNPFNPNTAIRYTMPQSGNVTIKVYNVLGSEIATLFNGNQSAGRHTLNFNAGNLSSGIYFVRMNANGFTTSKKMMLVK